LRQRIKNSRHQATLQELDDLDCHIWTSEASGLFVVTKMIDKAQKITQGTRSMLHLKDDIPEYLKQKKVKDSIEFTLNQRNQGERSNRQKR